MTIVLVCDTPVIGRGEDRYLSMCVYIYVQSNTNFVMKDGAYSA